MDSDTRFRIQSRTPAQTVHKAPNYVNVNMKRTSSSNSDSHHRQESFHSPLRSNSPLNSDDPDPDPNSLPTPYASPSASPLKSPRFTPPERQNSKAIVAVAQPLPPAPEKAVAPAPAVSVHNLRGEPAPTMTKVGPGGERGSDRAVSSIMNRSRNGEVMKVANLGFRLSEVVLCLISFSVMAADKTKGWAGDSFDRYREYRFFLSF